MVSVFLNAFLKAPEVLFRELLWIPLKRPKVFHLDQLFGPLDHVKRCPVVPMLCDNILATRPMHSLIAFFDKPFVGFMLKLLAGIATAIFGIIGLGRNVRKRNGTLTPKGRMALIGIVVAAVLASGSGIYDYFSSQESAREERLRSERLFTSVQRGLYPFKGMTASYTLYFLKDFRGLAEYRNELRSSISKDRDCTKPSEFQCFGYDDKGPYLYQVSPNSSLFPKKQSPLRVIFENVGLAIYVFKKGLDPKGGKNAYHYSPVGSFGVSALDRAPDEWSIYYDWKMDKVGVNIERLEVPDKTLLNSEVFSLTDIVPGAMVAQPYNTGSRLCFFLTKRYAEDCEKDYVLPLNAGLTIELVTLSFSYPKRLMFGLQNTLPCKPNGLQQLASFFLDDIDSGPSLDNGTFWASPDEKKLLCAGMIPPRETQE